MKHAVLAALTFALLAAAPSPAPLVAGSVRDQRGVPIEGARVAILEQGKVVGSALTAPDGTFVFSGAGSEALISCAYCRSARVAIGEDGLVVALVTRYEAVRTEGPSNEDLSHLPYASPATVLALVPFIVVNETSYALPGLSATDRNATPYGGLLVVDDAQDYDVTANASPFGTIPQGDFSALSVRRVDRASGYGNLAEGGTFVFTNTGGDSYVSAGSDTLARTSLRSGSVEASAAFSNARPGVRAERGAARIGFEEPNAIEDLTLSSGAGYASSSGSNALLSSFSSVVGEMQTRNGIDAHARVTLDRGSYAYTSPRFPESAAWSDSDFEIGVTSHAAVAPFVSFSLRQSSGNYLSFAAGSDPIGASLSQARASAGIMHRSHMFDALVAFGNSRVSYAGVFGPGFRASQALDDAVASVTYRPANHWSLHASTSSGYTLASFRGMYVPASLGYPNPRPATLGHTDEAIVEYTDASRLRIDATALAWSGDGGVATSSAGASVAWQVAPNVSLRTWFLREASNAWNPGNVGNAWLTFANGDSFRVDALWERSLLDRAPRTHLEGSISGRLSERIDWFAASTRAGGVQEYTGGVRIH